MPELEEEIKVCKTLSNYGNSDFNFFTCILTEDFGIGEDTVEFETTDDQTYEFST